ncbi:very short patch repair endonuclease [Halomonas shantousis]
MKETSKTKSRSEIMAAVKSKNTSPEMKLRRFLHNQGFRYRLHKEGLPGKPDLVFSRYKLALFVHGCFWHRHSGCRYASQPATNLEYWNKKFSRNIERDARQQKELLAQGWRVLVIWECGTKHAWNEAQEIEEIIKSNESYSQWPIEPPRKIEKDFG